MNPDAEGYRGGTEAHRESLGVRSPCNLAPRSPLAILLQVLP